MEVGGFVREQVRKGGRHRFCFSKLLISLIEILLINQEVGNKKGSKTEDIFCTQYLNLFT